MEKDLAEGIKRVAQALNKHEVKYMFVGGVAISFYANPRPSANLPKGIEYDIDIWYQANIDNFTKLIGGISEISPELKNELDKIIFDLSVYYFFFAFDIDFWAVFT